MIRTQSVAGFGGPPGGGPGPRAGGGRPGWGLKDSGRQPCLQYNVILTLSNLWRNYKVFILRYFWSVVDYLFTGRKSLWKLCSCPDVKHALFLPGEVKCRCGETQQWDRP